MKVYRFCRLPAISMPLLSLSGENFPLTVSPGYNIVLAETDAVFLAVLGDEFVLIAASVSFPVKEVGCRFSTSQSSMLLFFRVSITTSVVSKSRMTSPRFLLMKSESTSSCDFGGFHRKVDAAAFRGNTDVALAHELHHRTGIIIPAVILPNGIPDVPVVYRAVSAGAARKSPALCLPR